MKNTTQKGFIVPLVIAISVLVIAGGIYYVSKLKPTTTSPVTSGTSPVTETASTTVFATASTTYMSKDGYSFVYPTKLSLSTTSKSATLSHTIPFENINGGCDMIGEGPVSKTLTDFELSFEVKAGTVTPDYVDGTYSKGSLDGKWAYMGAEGCGETMYYFPISKNRTLIVTKTEVQVLSNVVDPQVKANVLKIPGAISSEEAKLIMDEILSSFSITN